MARYHHAFVVLGFSLAACTSPVLAQAPTEATMPVTADNFIRAETNLYFATPVRQAGGTGRFFHYEWQSFR